MYDVLQKPGSVGCWACEKEEATRYHWSKPLCQECYAKVTKAESDKWFKNANGSNAIPVGEATSKPE